MPSPRAGLWQIRPTNSFWSWLIASMVMIASIRGIIVVHSSLPVQAVYFPVAAALLMLAIFGYFQRKAFKDQRLLLLKNLFKLNLLLGAVNVAVDLFLNAPLEFGLAYTFIAPYVVFLFLRVPARYLHASIIVITVAIGYSVCTNFVDVMFDPYGYEKVFEYNLRLRPETFRALSHTEGVYRVGGYTGSYHDSANILGMAVSFFVIRYLWRRRILDLGLSLFAVLSMTLTQSAANIAVAAFTVLIFAGYLLYSSRNTLSYVYLLLGVGGAALLIAFFGDAMGVFVKRLGTEGDWEGMLSGLDTSLIWSKFGVILFGHAAAMGDVLTGIEVAHISLTGQLGIVHAAIVFGIMLYPLFSLVKAKGVPPDALASAAAVFFGFMSLLHYNSVMKVTSFFLFFALYAICLKSILSRNDSQRISPATGASSGSLPPTQARS
ncbi:MAG: hypothetical protein SGJ20_14840 [Planctomycetota bacterium]|nr:hypothetical protein [Planctomycetota bacterium]